MVLTVYLLLATPLILLAITRPASRHLAPPVASRLLVAALLLGASATVGALAALAVGGLAHIAEVQSGLGLPSGRVNTTDPTSRLLGVVAAGILALLAVRLLLVVGTLRREQRSAAALRLLPAAGDLVIADDDQPDAFALGGRPGRVVVTTGMLRALDSADRAVMLAHERAHLRHRHAWYVTAARAASALNPLLSPLVRDLDYVLERWADESAATHVGSRSSAARALGRAALASHPSGLQHGLAYLRHRVLARVTALQAAPPRSRWSMLIPPALIAVTMLLALGDVATGLHRLVDLWGI